MYLNISTYLSQQMQWMYTETPCFGENKWTQKITQNTRKYILRRATKVTIAKFQDCRRKEKNSASRMFFGGSHENDAHVQSFFARNAGSHARLGYSSAFRELPDLAMQIVVNLVAPYQIKLDGDDRCSEIAFAPCDGNELDVSGLKIIYAPFIRPERTLWTLRGPVNPDSWEGKGHVIEIKHDGDKRVSIRSGQFTYGPGHSAHFNYLDEVKHIFLGNRRIAGPHSDHYL